MPPPKPPSRVEPLAFPVFAMSWYANPGSGESVLAYCGGGGSARTGVNNAVVVRYSSEPLPQKLSTGEHVGVALQLYASASGGGGGAGGRLWLVVALSIGHVLRYELPSGQLAGTVYVGEPCSAIAVDCTALTLAVGCESGKVKLYSISDYAFGMDENGSEENCPPVHTCISHQEAVCCVAFSNRDGRLISSAKDGTACIWKEGKLWAGLKCSIPKDAKAAAAAAKSKKPPSVLVRGCAFGDLDGKIAYTVASGRRGKAFLTRWKQAEARKFACDVKTCVSEHPVSAVNLSQCGSVLALGSTDGSITLWDVQEWKPIRKWPEVHAFPVTCIAVRPLMAMPLLQEEEEEDGVIIHARSASADGQLACLTLQKKAPRKAKSSSSSLGTEHGFCYTFCHFLMTIIHSAVMTVIVWWILHPVVEDAKLKCHHVWEKQLQQHDDIATADSILHFYKQFTVLVDPVMQKCLWEECVWAPSKRPGVGLPPY